MKLKNEYKPTLFFIIAFAITWINGAFLAVTSHQGGDKNIINLLLAYMGPYLAALIMMFAYHDKPFRADFRKRIYSFSLLKKKLLPFSILLMPAAMLLSILISIVLGQPVEQLRFAEEFKIFDGEIILSMIILALVPFLEELGWRGYGVDSLAQRFNLFKTSMIFGFLWGAWHLPVFFIKNSYQSSLWIENPIFAINFFVGIIPLAFISNFLYYKHNRSILLLALFHILVNFSAEIFSANQISKCLLTGVLFLTAIMIVVRNKSFFFKEKMLT